MPNDKTTPDNPIDEIDVNVTDTEVTETDLTGPEEENELDYKKLYEEEKIKAEKWEKRSKRQYKKHKEQKQSEDDEELSVEEIVEIRLAERDFKKEHGEEVFRSVKEITEETGLSLDDAWILYQAKNPDVAKTNIAKANASQIIGSSTTKKLTQSGMLDAEQEAIVEKMLAPLKDKQ